MKKEVEEKIEHLEKDVKRLNKKVFPPKEIKTRGDPVVMLS